MLDFLYKKEHFFSEIMKCKASVSGNRILRDNTKLMGISNWLAETHRIEAVSKARHDKSLPRAYCKQPKDDVVDDDEPMRSANAKYKSWLVSYIRFPQI